MSIIEVTNLTKDYGRGRGVFDVTFAVKEGEAFGFLGPNRTHDRNTCYGTRTRL